jgi:hypothetical protein
LLIIVVASAVFFAVASLLRIAEITPLAHLARRRLARLLPRS